jgi:hypothetical protein
MKKFDEPKRNEQRTPLGGAGEMTVKPDEAELFRAYRSTISQLNRMQDRPQFSLSEIERID